MTWRCPIIDIRQGLKLTQAGLGEALGCSQASVSRMEQGLAWLDLRQYRRLEQLCREAGLEMPAMDDLIGPEGAAPGLAAGEMGSAA